MRKREFAAILAFVLVLGARASADGNAADSADGVFFREPDKATRDRIAELISRVHTGSVDDRRSARRELEAIGFWSVEPLIDAQARMEPPVRSASVLVLDAIRDRRAIDPLRASVAKEVSDRYVAAFATLALGRFRDAASVDVLRTAVKTPKTMDLLKAAVPFALAKIHTPEARDLVLERVRFPGQREPIRSAALLSLGFFPEAAMSPSGTTPGPDLAAGLASKRRGERQAALLGFLVASSARGDSKQAVREILTGESAPEVAMVALLGLARSPDADVTELFAQTASRQGDDQVRELAADLLYDRVDRATKATVAQTAHSATSARLRAACVLALGRLEDDDARRVVIERLGDKSAIVRAAAAVALTRRNVPGARESAIAALEPRIKHGETNDDVRADFEKARAVLAGERTDVRWNEIGGETLFSEMSLTWPQRLLRAVNLRVMASLDLEKIHNLQTDSEIVASGPPGVPVDGNGGEPGGGDVDPGSGDPGTPGQPNDSPSGQPTGDAPAAGAPRTSQYQEQRDLKTELLRHPYFGEADLPAPITTPGPAQPAGR